MQLGCATLIYHFSTLFLLFILKVTRYNIFIFIFILGVTQMSKPSCNLLWFGLDPRWLHGLKSNLIVHIAPQAFQQWLVHLPSSWLVDQATPLFWPNRNWIWHLVQNNNHVKVIMISTTMRNPRHPKATTNNLWCSQACLLC